MLVSASRFSQAEQFVRTYGSLNNTAFGVPERARPARPTLATLLYIGFLRRSPEPAGADLWTAELNRGVSPVAVVGSFVDSAEYLSRY